MINLLVELIIIGAVLFLINRIPAIEGWVKQVINVVAAILVLLIVLNFFGLYSMPYRLR